MNDDIDFSDAHVFLDQKERRFAQMARRCINSRFILRNRSQELFLNLNTYHKELNQYFMKMGLELKLDNELGIAQLVDIKELELQYSAGKKIKLGARETILTIYLRQKRMDYFTGDPESEVATISEESMREFLNEFNQEKEDKKFQREFKQTIKRLLDLQILLNLQEEYQYEISPICDLIIPADHIQLLLDKAKIYFYTSSDIEQNLEVQEEQE